MDLELKHLGQTLAIGGFAVYASLLLVRICRAKWIPSFFRAGSAKPDFQHAAVYLALTFAAGVVLEDASKSYVTHRALFNPPFMDFILSSESELRFRSLVREATMSRNEITGEALPLMNELQSIGSPPGHVEAFLKTIRAAMQPSAGTDGTLAIHVTGEDSVKALFGAIDGVYYDAKNRVYRQDTYFRELSDIAERINSTRSLTLLCFWFAILYAIFGFSAFIAVVGRFLDIDKTERRTVFLLCLLFVVGVWFARSAYRSESIAYDIRVFGYYASLANKTDEQQEKVSP